MSADTSGMPWLNTWLEVQRAFSQLTEQGAKGDDPVAQGMRRLTEFANDYAGVAADCWRKLQAGEPDLGELRVSLVERYQRLFMPAIAPAAPAANALASNAAFIRYQQASQRFGQQAAAISVDAFKRLSASLETNDPAAPPITSLRELHALWVECGEAAFSAAAHGDEFAAAQAELLASLVELRHEQMLRR
ncbi:MAG: poly(R)-hydroxyalkanoic acid synthase subunit PhaE [Steroidobacteraceae bacterium]